MTPELPPDAEVVSILDELGENESALLPELNTWGDWNEVTAAHNMHTHGPRSRDYTNKAAWMPDRRRAFFCGANHGAPHRLNDAWEYDLPSNTWAMLFAPDPNNAVGVLQIREGEIRGTEPPERVHYVSTERGGPTHYGHTWWGLTYEPTLGAALWMNVAIGTSSVSYLEEQLGEDAAIYRGPPLWAFYPEKRRWEMVLTQAPRPSTPYGFALEYIPELGGAVWYAASWNGQGMNVYEPLPNTWRNLLPNDGESLYHNTETPKSEAIHCYDREQKTLVAQDRDRSTFHYDVATNRWSQVLPATEDTSVAPYGHDARSQIYFNPISKVCMLFDPDTPEHIWSYEAAHRRWTRHTPQGPAAPTSRVISYFDEARNVFVVNSGKQTWVYRLAAR